MSLHKVRNIELMSQVVLSEGLVFGKCGTTDIDLSCDWQGKTFVFVELKWGRTLLTRGQKYHLEGLVDGLVAGGRIAHAILANHDAKRGEPIMAQTSSASRIYSGHGWQDLNSLTLGELMNELYAEHLEDHS